MKNNTMENDNKKPIGIFDSGMGGLTILKELIKTLPHEAYLYLGDTARLPYGTKSQKTVAHYTLKLTSILVKRDIKLLIVACNTASTAALPALKHAFPHIPIMGVIDSGARLAVETTQKRCVAVLATETTTRSRIYENTIHALDPRIEVITQSCGLFVALAEEGFSQGDISLLAAEKYLKPLLKQKNMPDCVILGCTHFPVLINPISTVLGNQIKIINSAIAMALSIQKTMHSMNIAATQQQNHIPIRFFVTDLPERFIRIGPIFLGQPIDASVVELIDNNSY